MHSPKLPERFEIDFSSKPDGSLIYLGRSEHYSAQWILKEHSHGEYMEICYLAKGYQAFEIDGKLYELNGGNILVTQPGTVHSSAGKAMERSVLYWIIIDLSPKAGKTFLDLPPQEANTVQAELLNMGNVLLHGNSQFQKNLDNMIKSHIEAQPHMATGIRTSLTGFLLNVIELGQFPAGRVISGPTATAMDYIRRNIYQNITLESLAEAAGLSLSRFKQKFRNETGLGPREFILREKIKLASQMLTNGMRVTPIAHKLSFSSSQYFATVFRRYMNLSPLEYRKSRKN